MLSPLELLIPFIILVLISLPLVNVFRGKTSVKSAKVRMVSHICLFFALVLGTVFFSATKAYAAETADVADKMAGSIGQGLGFIAAALSTGLSALGAGIAVAAAVSTVTWKGTGNCWSLQRRPMARCMCASGFITASGYGWWR